MATYCDAYGYCYNDSWYTWGRWVLLGAIILFCLFICLIVRCVNSRRIKRGGGPVRYTGWTVPTYNQSQQQYGYTGASQPAYGQQGYNMNNYPQGQGQGQGQYSYQGPPQTAGQAGTGGYYDASQSAGPGGYQPPPYPPPTAKA